MTAAAMPVATQMATMTMTAMQPFEHDAFSPSSAGPAGCDGGEGVVAGVSGDGGVPGPEGVDESVVALIG